MCKGRKEDLPNTLEAMAAYLRREQLDVLHPVGLTQLTKRFANSNNSEEQVIILKNMGASKKDLESCSNVRHRKELFRTLTKQRYQ